MVCCLLFLAILPLLVSCPLPTLPLEDVLYPIDKTIPQVVEHSLEDNQTFRITFSENVEVVETVVGGTPGLSGTLGKTFRFTLPQHLEPGEETTFSMTVRKANGNTSRCSFTLTGVNDRLPKVLLNEISTKGTTSSPDRVELLVLEEGNTLGMCLSDGIDGNAYVFPSIEVRRGDLLVVYWNIRTTRTKEEKEEERYTVWYLNAASPATLSGSNGVLLLSETKNGNTMDAFLYSDSSSTLHSGYGSVKGEKGALKALEEGSWSGEPMDSSLVTSSRVFARLPGGVDTDSAGDWFVTAARKSTFGDRNTFTPHEET